MSEEVARWRLPVFRYAQAFVAIDVATYLCGVGVISVLESANAKIRAGAWLFLAGSALSLLALFMSMFGYGWKRIGLAIACLLTLPFWYGLTWY